MKARWFVALLAMLATIGGVALASRPAQALPEYAAQMGEPCASCHVSPSGGGPRSPRGLAWVAAGKLGAVPDLAQALEALGVHTQANPGDFQAPPGTPSPAAPLQLKQGQAGAYYRWLQNYPGN